MNILDLKFYSNDLEKEVTVKEFFFELMKTLWIEQDRFNGKRPFGNSGWDGDLIVCLIKNNLVQGLLDEDGYIESYDPAEVDKFVVRKILRPLFFMGSKNYIEKNNQKSLNNFMRSLAVAIDFHISEYARIKKICKDEVEKNMKCFIENDKQFCSRRYMYNDEEIFKVWLEIDEKGILKFQVKDCYE